MTSKKKKEALKKMLLEKKLEIWNEVKHKLFQQLGSEYKSEIDAVLDEGDKALSDLAAETGLTLVDLRKDMLEKIDHALAKLEEGTYGICDDCGNEINEQRLKAVPFAVYCVECKQKREDLEHIERERERFGITPPSEMGEESL
ncbi:MAG: TraR/DksA C4-type zinc finger protein [Nitrospirae bacterium]|nr:TraR/DksA C4-type zinc finger protein [Nitrospirota bacterium]